MAKDLHIAVNKITRLLTTAFDAYNKENIELDKETAKFWGSLKKRFDNEFVTSFEAEPTAVTEKFKAKLTELGDNIRVQMNFVMYLHNMGEDMEEEA